MSREAMSEEERRRRRNEASRRCYLKRKAALAGQAQPVGVKNKKPKTKPVETKQAKPARRGPDPIVAAERLCKTYAKVANGIKPMIKDAAEFLGVVYKSEDQRVVEKVERILAKGLGISISRLASDPTEKTRICLDAVSKAVKTPKFRLTSETSAEPEPVIPEPEPVVPAEPDNEDAPAEVIVDPALLEKVDAGEADKSEIEIPQGRDDGSDEDDNDDELDQEDDELENEDEDDEDDEDDDSEEAQERRARRREREESNNVRDWESGRWEMMGEMGAQGAFDD